MAGADLVSVEVGGNDARFRSVITTCALPRWLSDCDEAVAGADRVIREALPGRLAGLMRRIDARAPRAVVVVVGYPKLFMGEDCNAATFFSPAEQKRLAATQRALNAALRTAAAAEGFAFADPTAAFTGHAVCDDTEWVNGLSAPLRDRLPPQPRRPPRRLHAAGTRPPARRRVMHDRSHASPPDPGACRAAVLTLALTGSLAACTESTSPTAPTPGLPRRPWPRRWRPGTSRRSTWAARWPPSRPRPTPGPWRGSARSPRRSTSRTSSATRRATTRRRRRLSWSWPLPADDPEPWTYTTEVALERTGEEWVPTWAPTVVEGSLAEDEVLDVTTVAAGAATSSAPAGWPWSPSAPSCASASTAPG